MRFIELTVVTKCQYDLVSEKTPPGKAWPLIKHNTRCKLNKWKDSGAMLQVLGAKGCYI